MKLQGYVANAALDARLTGAEKEYTALEDGLLSKNARSPL